jgi:hypothetical protein
MIGSLSKKRKKEKNLVKHEILNFCLFKKSFENVDVSRGLPNCLRVTYFGND